jgi:hypothetical protein
MNNKKMKKVGACKIQTKDLRIGNKGTYHCATRTNLIRIGSQFIYSGEVAS